MPLLQINAGSDGLTLHRAPHSILPVLRRALRVPGPIVIMVHGYKFAPGHARACPHNHILSLDPGRTGWKVKSWPRALGFGLGAEDEGLAIAFGWPARGTIWQAYAQAERAATCLAELMEILCQLAPRRRVHIVAHSLGARVALQALPRMSCGHPGRVILLNGAEFGEHARVALDSPTGKGAEFINVTSRENDLFDFLLERLVRAPRSGDRCVSHALPARHNSLTLQLDHPCTRDALDRAGFPLASATFRVCHWSAYLRPGVFKLYRALLRSPATLALDDLRHMLPDAPEPRWSGMFRLSGPVRPRHAHAGDLHTPPPGRAHRAA
ncbi:MAG: alpha/beta hydrolase [Pseudomonadota bacterium]